MNYKTIVVLFILLITFKLVKLQNENSVLYKCTEEVSENILEIPKLRHWFYPPEKLEYFKTKNRSLPLFTFPLKLQLNSEEKKCQYFNLTVPLTTKIPNTYFAFGLDGTLAYGAGSDLIEEIYFHPENFCISKITNDSLDLNICQSQCHIKDSQNGSSLCLPRCCLNGQVMTMDSTGRRECFNAAKDEWTIPTIYSNLHSNSKIPGLYPQFQFNYYKDYWNCTTSLQYHIFSPDKIRILSDGQLYQKPRRKWSQLYPGGGSRNFCMEGFWNKSESSVYDPSKNEFFLLSCTPAQTSLDDYLYYYPKLVFAVFLISTLIHLMTISVYVVLWNTQNVHGWTAFTLALSQFLLNLFLTIIFAMFAFAKPAKILIEFNWLCVFIGICHHFLLICSFSWSSVFAFDVWAKIRSMSRGGSGKKRFMAYCGFGFGIPIIVVMLGVILEFSGDEDSGFISPQYRDTCIIQNGWEYFTYITISITFFFLVNMFFALHTLKTVWDAKKGVQKFDEKDAKTKSKSTAVDKRFKLIMKLFVLVGVFFFFEIVLAFVSPIDVSIYFCVLDFYRIANAVGLFYILICNKRLFGQLTEKYPPLGSLVQFVSQLSSKSGKSTSQNMTNTNYSKSDLSTCNTEVSTTQ